MKDFLINVLIASLFLASCTPKEPLTDTQRLIGNYRLVAANCGNSLDSFIHHSFIGIEFREDGTGTENYLGSFTQEFEYSIDGERIEVCYTNCSVSSSYRFGFLSDTLLIRSRNNICSDIKYKYVKL
jgi:hypothetical protein